MMAASSGDETVTDLGAAGVRLSASTEHGLHRFARLLEMVCPHAPVSTTGALSGPRFSQQSLHFSTLYFDTGLPHLHVRFANLGRLQRGKIEASMEQWRTVECCPYYDVSDAGRVRSWKANRWGRAAEPRILKATPDIQGYPAVNLGRKTRRVHRLVMQAFVGPCPDGHEVNHINSDRTDCRLSNLEYVTRVGNMRHAYDYGFLVAPEPPRGTQHPLSKLTDDIVREIRTSPDNGCVLGRKFGVTPQVIYRVRSRKMWKHVA
jgi:hypothetical protein